jgi:hypothetical protein
VEQILIAVENDAGARGATSMGETGPAAAARGRVTP